MFAESRCVTSVACASQHEMTGRTRGVSLSLSRAGLTLCLLLEQGGGGGTLSLLLEQGGGTLCLLLEQGGVTLFERYPTVFWGLFFPVW